MSDVVPVRQLPGDRWTVRLYSALAVVEVGFTAWSIADGAWWAATSNAAIAGLCGSFIFVRRGWIRIGWSNGRREVMDSAVDAMMRGQSIGTWIMDMTRADLERLGLVRTDE